MIDMPTLSPCRGRNCLSTGGGQGHSLECQLEHDAACLGARIVWGDEPALFPPATFPSAAAELYPPLAASGDAEPPPAPETATKPEPEPVPATPRRWWWVSLTAMLGGWGGVGHFSGAFCGDTRSAAIDRAREEVAARDDGHGGDWTHAKATANELTPTALAAMLAESRAWYARELERSGEVGE